MLNVLENDTVSQLSLRLGGVMHQGLVLAIFLAGVTFATHAMNIETLTQQAKAGDAEAQWQLANAYRDGVAVPQDSSMAVYWLQRAAAKGHGEALSVWQQFAAKGVVPADPKTGIGADENIRRLNEKAAKEQLESARKEYLEENLEDVSGKILQVLSDGALMVKQSRTQHIGSRGEFLGFTYGTPTYFFVYTEATATLSDGAYERFSVLPTSNYTYTDVQGAQRTVKGYRHFPTSKE